MHFKELSVSQHKATNIKIMEFYITTYHDCSILQSLQQTANDGLQQT